MYKKIKIKTTKIRVNQATEGESIENKFQRILENNEPITDGAPIIYTDRKDGVLAGYNIRTDRFDVALEGMNVVHRATTAKRDNKAAEGEKKDGEAEPIQANNSDNTKEVN